ncbi:unnamed protein product [Urochloa humidicola]
MAAEENGGQGRNPRRRRKMVPRSAVWEHFNRFTDDNGRDKARCKRCLLVLGAGTRNGTSTLWGHVKICCKDWDGVRRRLHRRPTPLPPCAASSRSAETSRRDPGLKEEEEEAIGDLARMIALSGYDPSVLEDGYFRSFLRRLNPEFKLPSRLVVEEVCDGIFDETREDFFSRLRRAPGRISLAVGKAEAVEGDVFYTACHFIDDDWKLHRMVMDAYDHVPCPLYNGPLSGVPEVSLHFQDLCTLAIHRVMAMDGDLSVPGRDVLDRVFMVARDKRDRYVRLDLKDYIQKKFHSTNRPRMRELICDTYKDILLHQIAQRLALHKPLALDMIDGHFIELGVQGLHLTRKERQHILSHLSLDSLRVHHQRWYSCYCSLEVLRGKGSCRIAGIDSKLIELLCNVWGSLYHAIKRISTPSSPTSNLCLRELFNVREVLQSEIAQTGGDNADALRDARDTLDRSIQDSYLVWSIPLVLDPRYKLSYIKFSFGRAFSSEAAHYISEVTREIKKLYGDYIECDVGISGTNADGAMAMAVGSADPLEQAWVEHCRTQVNMTSEVARSSRKEVASSYPEAETELDRYLKDRLAPHTEGFDILSWWKIHSSEYPMVARMARDALAMPTCSQLSSEQIAHVRNIVRGYSKEEYIHQADATE